MSQNKPSANSQTQRQRRVTRQREAGEATRRETRRRLLVAAAGEFADRGYAGATVARIADRADVAVPTLYSAWGSKRALLRAVMATAVTGREDGFAPGGDPNILLGPANAPRPADPAAFITHLAHRYRLIAERSAVGWRTYRDGAGVDPEIATDWQQLQDGRRDVLRVLIANLPSEVLRPGLTPDSATDTAWAIASPETHELLVLRRGWSYDQYESWIASTLTAALLDSATDPTPARGMRSAPSTDR
jgi:AcrR family transcriptional regulator